MQGSAVNVIDALGEGFAVAPRALLALAVPVAVDLLLWVGPRLLPAPVVVPLATLLAGLEAAGAAGVGEALTAALAEANLLTLLAVGVLTVPSLMASGLPAAGTAWPLEHGWQTAVAACAALGLGTLLGALYVHLIIDELEGKAKPEGGLVRAVLSSTGRLLLWSLLIVGLAVVVVLPASLVTALLAQVHGALVTLVLVTSLGAALAMWFYLVFTGLAIVLQGVGPRRAMWSSAMVVARDPWRVLAFLLVVHVILGGTTVIWHRLAAAHVVGVLLAILGHALVATAISAAAIIFYGQRYRAWRGSR